MLPKDNRPLVLVGQALKPAQIAGLCRRGAIAFLDRGIVCGVRRRNA